MSQQLYIESNLARKTTENKMSSYDENQWSPEALEKASSSLKALNRIAKRPPINIAFKDIRFIVSTHKDNLEILRNVSGEFHSGELTCILGPSGAGKSTLLNILAGYTTKNVDGRITINGHNREMHIFKKLSCYIMQENLLQPRLTLLESMRIAADLKLGTEFEQTEKDLIVEEILKTLGLWDHRNTRSEFLSGGESKRLSIALELVNNPPVIFLDEPTSGLDIVSVRQLVVLLHLLSRQGRTIVCTIHQPSASLFSLFDHVYIISKGLCSYQGAAPLLIPFLTDIGYVCPSTHNPADFVLETIANDPEVTNQMSELCQNGKLSRKSDESTVLHSEEYIQRIFVEHIEKERIQKMEFPTTFLTQFLILSKGCLPKVTLLIQLVHHFVSAVFIGCIYFHVGNDAASPIVNYKFCLSILVFFMYTYIMIPVLLFPMEVKMLRREYFNRWYGLKAYYMAITFASLPAMVIFGLLFMIIAYLMSGQILEWDRFALFAIGGILTAVCSEGLGMAIGCTFNSTNGAIIGPSTASPLLMLCSYGMGFGQYIEPQMRILMSLSYLRYGLTGVSIALYHKRSPMECSKDFCLYSDPALILRDVGMSNDTYSMQMFGLLVFIVLHRMLGYFVLRYRLSSESSNSIFVSILKVLRRK